MPQAVSLRSRCHDEFDEPAGPTIGGDEVTGQKAMVERYTDGFRTGDLAQILSCLPEDVVWALRGDETLVGRNAFADDADPAMPGSPTSGWSVSVSADALSHGRQRS
jgi:hypothetical protein